MLENSQVIQGGLCVGSSDIVGVGLGGKFIALEVKTDKVAVTKVQKNFIKIVQEFGGIAGIVRSVEEVDELLGLPA